jgi:hypothetical protein
MTHYLMEKEPLLLQDQAGRMDVVVADRWDTLKKIWVLQGQAQVVWLLVLYV